MKDILWHFFDLGGGNIKRYAWNYSSGGNLTDDWTTELTPTAGTKLVILDMQVNFNEENDDGAVHLRFGTADDDTKIIFSGIAKMAVIVALGNASVGKLSPYYFDFADVPKVGGFDEVLQIKAGDTDTSQPAIWISYLEVPR